MSNTPYMSLTLPDVSVTIGPDWAAALNLALESVDSHNHTGGQGNLVPVGGMLINADLSMEGYNLTEGRSLRMENHGSALAEATDLGCLFVAANELYYRDGLGNSIQLTASGALNAASIGGIGGDYSTSTASLAYSSTTKKFTFLQAANTPAIIDCGNVVVRKNTASSNGITLTPAAGIAADYTLTLPAALPVSTLIAQVDSSGNISLTNTVASLAVTAGVTVGTTLGVTGATTLTGGVDGGLSVTGAITATTTITATGNVRGAGITTDGTNVIRFKVLSGTSSAAGELKLAHGLTASKIIGISGHIYASSLGFYTEANAAISPSVKMWDSTYAYVKLDYAPYYSSSGKIIVFYIP